jgi:membrane-associated phospholipid phosphatase
VAVPRLEATGVRRAPTVLWYLAAAYALATTGAYLFFVRTGVGQRLDAAAEAPLRPPLVEAESLLRGLDVSALVAVLAAIGVLAFWRGRADLATVVVAVVLGSNVTTQVLKHTVFERPHLISEAYRLPNSFPSGHVTAAASIAIAAVLVMSRRLRPAVALAGSATTMIVGLATVAAGWHRPSDVMGAWFVVGAWAALATAAMVAIGGTGTPLPAGRASTAIEVSIWVVGGAAASAFVVCSGAWVGLHWADAADTAVAATRQGLAMTGSVSGMVAASILVPGSLVAATRRFSLAPEWLGPR